MTIGTANDAFRDFLFGLFQIPGLGYVERLDAINVIEMESARMSTVSTIDTALGHFVCPNPNQSLLCSSATGLFLSLQVCFFFFWALLESNLSQFIVPLRSLRKNATLFCSEITRPVSILPYSRMSIPPALVFRGNFVLVLASPLEKILFSLLVVSHVVTIPHPTSSKETIL